MLEISDFIIFFGPQTVTIDVKDTFYFDIII